MNGKLLPADIYLTIQTYNPTYITPAHQKNSHNLTQPTNGNSLTADVLPLSTAA
jgi:hypothetical protein